MDRFAINPLGEDGTYTADFAEDILQQLLQKPGYRNGQGEWLWTIFAQQADLTHCSRGYQIPIQETIGHWK